MEVPILSGEIFGIPRILRKSWVDDAQNTLIRACIQYEYILYYIPYTIKYIYICTVYLYTYKYTTNAYKDMICMCNIYIYMYANPGCMTCFGTFALVKVQSPWLCPATLAPQQMEMIHGIKNISKEGVRRYEAMGCHGDWMRLGCRVWWRRDAGMV